MINDNQLESIPSSIGLLRNLHTLIADSNHLEDIPSSIGSCLKLRIFSVADNLIRGIPDDVGRLSCLRVLSLSGNRLKFLPFSLIKLNQLQALWLSTNQQKPLMKLQTDIDEDTGQKVLTCFMLPQDVAESDIEIKTSTKDQKYQEKQSAIRFTSEQQEDEEGNREKSLTRNPTPYPKELKAHAKHAKNLALKVKDTPIKPDVVEESRVTDAANWIQEPQVSSQRPDITEPVLKQSKLLPTISSESHGFYEKAKVRPKNESGTFPSDSTLINVSSV